MAVTITSDTTIKCDLGDGNTFSYTGKTLEESFQFVESVLKKLKECNYHGRKIRGQL